MSSLGITSPLQNLMIAVGDFEEDKDEEFSESFDPDDGFALETPPYVRKSVLANTMVGKSLLKLVNSDDANLSPTSRSIKKLSEEVLFGL